MTDAKNQSGMAYHVTVTRRDAAHAVAETRGHTLSLNVKKGDGAAASMPPKRCWRRWARAF